jgi:hypothetical protein
MAMFLTILGAATLAAWIMKLILFLEGDRK